MSLNMGMRCHDLCPKMELEKLFPEIKAHGIREVQLAFSKSVSNYDFSVGHYSPGFARYIKSLLDENGVHVAVLGCYINPVNPIEEQRKAEVARFIEHLKYARVIGADMVGTETGRLSADFRVTKETYTEDAYRLFLKSMEEIVEAAESLGVIVGIEGVYNHTLYSPARVRRFFNDIASPNVEAILDPVNMLHPDEVAHKEQERIMDQVFTYYGEKIGALHIKDFVFDGEEQLYRHVGDGQFYYEPFLKRVKELKPQIVGLFENSSPERIAGDMEFIQKIYDRV